MEQGGFASAFDSAPQPLVPGGRLASAPSMLQTPGDSKQYPYVPVLLLAE